MATSASTNLSVTAEEIAKAALQQVRVIKSNPPFIPKDLMDVARFRLNLILKEWSSHGLHLWIIEKGSVYLAEHKYIYKLGQDFPTQFGASGSGSDLYRHVYNFATIAVGTSSVDVPVLYADWPWGDPSAASDMRIAVLTDTNYLYDTTIDAYAAQSTYTRLTTGVDLSSVCTDSSGYTGVIKNRTNDMVVDVIDNEINLVYKNAARDKKPLTMLGRESYENLNTDTQEGIPNTVYFRRSRTDAELFVWPVPDSNATDYTIEFNYLRLIEDLDDRANTVEIPITFAKAIQDQLVFELSTTFNLPLEERVLLGQFSESSRRKALGFDREHVPMKIRHAKD